MIIYFKILIILFYLYFYFTTAQKEKYKYNKALLNSKKIINVEKKLNIFYEEIIFNYINNLFNIKIINNLYILFHCIAFLSLFLHFILFENDIINNIIYKTILLFISYYIYIKYPTVPFRLINKKSLKPLTICNYNIQPYIINYHSFPSIHILISLLFSELIYLYYNIKIIIIYPFVTIFTILGSKNHYIIDLLFSAFIFIISDILIEIIKLYL